MTEAQGIPITAAPAVKTAWKTTEGWLAAISAGFGAACASLGIAGSSPIVQLGGLLLMTAATVAHSWGRATVKAAQVSA
jgi:hypothetical protein